MLVMQLSRALNKTWRETYELLESDEDELAMQLAYNQLRPLPDYWMMWATLFETQMSGKKFNYERWLPYEKKKKKNDKPTWQEIRDRMAILR